MNRIAFLDRCGIAVSCACALHCIAIPLVAGMLPLVGRNLVEDTRLEWLFLLSSISIGLITLLTGVLRHHGKAYPTVGFFAGISIIFITRIFLEESRALEIAGLMTGAVLLTGSHLLNLRLCRGCRDCEV